MYLTMNATPTSGRNRIANRAPHSPLGFVIACDASIVIDHDWAFHWRDEWSCPLRHCLGSMRVGDGTQSPEARGQWLCSIDVGRCG